MLTPAPVQVILCHKNKPWVPREEPVARQLELLLVGDPNRREDGREWAAFAEAIPLHEGVNLFSFTNPPSDTVTAGSFLDEALHTLVVALVDSSLLADPTMLGWLNAAAGYAGASSSRHRLLAVMRSDETQDHWHELKGHSDLNIYQTLDFSKTGERSERMDWLGLRVVYEILHMAALGSGASVGWKPLIFVSHTKKGGLSLAKGLRDLVGLVPWLDSFYDARDIGNACPWEKEIEEAVASSVLVALRTDQYDHRPYCRKEIMWAERFGVPMVLVDARQGAIHAASYLPFELAPCVRISDGNLVRVLHAALRVLARALVFSRYVTWLRQTEPKWKKASVRVISVRPGISAVAEACQALRKSGKKTRLLFYLGPLQPGCVEAAEALAQSAQVELVSPSFSFRQNLAGLRVGISVSESDDLAQWGVTPAGVNRLIVSFARAILSEGACLAFGHDWRDDGVMNALCNYALEVRSSLPFNPEDPMILNLVPWPDETQVPREEVEALEGILLIEQAGLPAELRPHAVRFAESAELARFLRSRGLTHLRRALMARTGARICLGGRAEGFAGRYPGVLEEALLSLQGGQPVYFIGLLGGVSKILGQALLDKIAIPTNFGKSSYNPTREGGRPLVDLYRERASTCDDETLDLAAAFEQIRTVGVDRLSKLNGLTVEENRLLLDTRIEQEAIRLVLRGMRNIVGGKT